jgi:hypothetical protein
MKRRTASGLIAGVMALGLLAGVASAQDAAAPGGKPSLDPFLTLIEKKRKAPPPKKPTVFRPPPPTVARIPPLVVKMSTVISSGEEHMAVIEYKGQDYVVGKGWDGAGEKDFDGRFRVVDVDIDKIVVYDTKAKQRRTIREEGGGLSGSGGGGELSLTSN